MRRSHEHSFWRQHFLLRGVHWDNVHQNNINDNSPILDLRPGSIIPRAGARKSERYVIEVVTGLSRRQLCGACIRRVWHALTTSRHCLAVRTGSIMLIKTITLHSFTFLIGITSSMAVHQVIPSDATARFKSGTETAAIFSQQRANRSIKSDRLPLNPAKPHLNDKAPIQVPAQIAPNLKFKTNCKPPIDVPGRCFAEARVKYRVG
jgi:hypothetical protein